MITREGEIAAKPCRLDNVASSGNTTIVIFTNKGQS